MKALTVNEFEAAPSVIQYFHMCATDGISIGSSWYIEVREKHPEYFQDEIEAMEKMSSIPVEVHIAYNEELAREQEIFQSSLPPSLGILGWADNPKKLEEYEKAHRLNLPKFKMAEKALKEKYYGPYGL